VLTEDEQVFVAAHDRVDASHARRSEDRVVVGITSYRRWASNVLNDVRERGDVRKPQRFLSRSIGREEVPSAPRSHRATVLLAFL